MHYKITIEYEGTNYLGWQKQKDQINKSIEEIIENAIFKLTHERVSLNCAGRTDAGVHAVAQVADFVIDKEFDEFRMMMGINNFLQQEQIIITNCEIVDDNFHSRFSACMRHYRYIIINRKSPLALMRQRAWHVPMALDLVAMQLAADYLIGEHDFSAFRDAKCEGGSPIRTVKKITLTQKGEEIYVDISAKSFLHHMVRNITGTLAWVGFQRISVDDMLLILHSRDRKNSGPNAPAHGLYFMGVDY